MKNTSVEEAAYPTLNGANSHYKSAITPKNLAVLRKVLVTNIDEIANAPRIIKRNSLSHLCNPLMYRKYVVISPINVLVRNIGPSSHDKVGFQRMK